MRRSFSLRPAQAGDAPSLARLFIETRQTCFTFIEWDYDLGEITGHFQGHVLPRQVVWLAETDGTIHGFMALEHSCLDRLYVLPGMQGLGIGRALLEKAKTLRPEGLELWVFQENAQARRFYERNGFVLERLTDGRDNMEKCPDAFYTWRPAEPPNDGNIIS